jgi:ABC-2 type transport system permease protein
VTLLRKTLGDAGIQVLIYGIGTAAFIALVVFIYPSFDESFEDTSSENLEAFVGSLDYTDARNYLNGQINYFAPLILAIFAITLGTGILAGEEGRGTLEVLLAQPQTRRQLFLEKCAGIGLSAVAVCLLACLGYLVSAPFIDLHDIDLIELVISPLAWVPFLWACMAISVVAGTVTPSRGQAVGIAAGYVILSYLAVGFAEISDGLSWLRYLSIYYYSDTRELLGEGVTPWHLLVLLALSAGLVWLALRTFENRELAAGRWQLEAALRQPR